MQTTETSSLQHATSSAYGATHDSERDVVNITEMSSFLVVLFLVSALALPVNVLLLYVTVFRGPSLQKTTQGAVARRVRALTSDRTGDVPVFLVSQGVFNVLICVTSPLDGVFLAREWTNSGGAGVVCAVFLAVKSVLLLFSVLVVSLQGLDKVYRVRHLHRPFFHHSARGKVICVGVAVVVSAFPLILELIVTRGQPLEDGDCRVEVVVVDVVEAIFFLGCVLSAASFTVVVLEVRKHRQRVSTSARWGRGDEEHSASTVRGTLTSPRLPSLSAVVDGSSREHQSARTRADLATLDLTSRTDVRVGTSQRQAELPGSSTGLSSNGNQEKNTSMHVSALSVNPARHCSIEKQTPSDTGTTESETHLSPPTKRYSENRVLPRGDAGVLTLATDLPKVTQSTNIPEVTHSTKSPEVIHPTNIPGVTNSTNIPEVVTLSTSIPEATHSANIPDTTHCTAVEDATHSTDIPKVTLSTGITVVTLSTNIPEVTLSTDPTQHSSTAQTSPCTDPHRPGSRLTPVETDTESLSPSENLSLPLDHHSPLSTDHSNVSSTFLRVPIRPPKNGLGHHCREGDAGSLRWPVLKKHEGGGGGDGMRLSRRSSIVSFSSDRNRLRIYVW